MNALETQLAGIRHVALDMDGTIYLSDTVFPYTAAFLEKLSRLGISYTFLTNNPTKSPADYQTKLSRMGINAALEQICTTSAAMVDYLKSELPDVRRLFVLGTPSLIRLFEDNGYEIAADDPADVPDAVIVSFDMTLTYSRLCRAAWWVSRGLPYLATNPDRVCPTDSDTVLVDCGSICRCIAHATGRDPDVTLGKPEPNMLLAIMRKKGLVPSQVAMVGDRLYTDMEMARRAGVLPVLVLSGETDSRTLSSASWTPSLVCRDISEFGTLLENVRK